MSPSINRKHYPHVSSATLRPSTSLPDPRSAADVSNTVGSNGLKNPFEVVGSWTQLLVTAKKLGVDHIAILQAAWALVLRYFQSEEGTCFFYENEVVQVRLNAEYSLKSLLVQFDNSQSSSTGQVQRVSPSQTSPSSAVCNSTLVIQRNEPPQAQAHRPKTDANLIVRLDETIVLASAQTSSADQNKSTLRTFEYVLSQIINCDNDTLVRELDYCSPRDTSMIRRFTQVSSHSNEADCLHSIIIENCRLYPDREAICSLEGTLTYGELAELSAKLAHYLVQIGVGPETYVLSSFQKSTWAIVARLAILRAGGAYISIHASNPPAYLTSVIERTNAKLMLSDPFFADQFVGSIESVVRVDPDWLRKLPSPSSSVFSSLGSTINSSTACTILFTSGSTGRPKAIIQEHKSYVSAIRDYTTSLGLASDTRFLQFDDYAFDISNLEYLVPLMLGGCCCVPGPMKTVHDLTENIRLLDVNIAFLTPTVAIKVNPIDVSGLKVLCVGGEPLPNDLIRKWVSSATRLINQFGMGEAAICCAYNEMVDAIDTQGGIIGRPSSGTIWITHPSDVNKIMPVGAIGEIVIEGPHLSRGYLDANHEAKDRTKPAGFLDYMPCWMPKIHPGSSRSNNRLYRSGDLARWDSRGMIHYVGRKDTIVKLDGCRIDVIEVENVARRCLTAKDAIVVDLLGMIDGIEDPQLAAFIYLKDHPLSSSSTELVLSDAETDSNTVQKVTEIKSVLSEVLPLYMVPTLFLLVPRLPQTASNKTDRRSLRLIGQDFFSKKYRIRSEKFSSSYKTLLLPP